MEKREENPFFISEEERGACANQAFSEIFIGSPTHIHTDRKKEGRCAVCLENFGGEVRYKLHEGHTEFLCKGCICGLMAQQIGAGSYFLSGALRCPLCRAEVEVGRPENSIIRKVESLRRAHVSLELTSLQFQLCGIITGWLIALCVLCIFLMDSSNCIFVLLSVVANSNPFGYRVLRLINIGMFCMSFFKMAGEPHGWWVAFSGVELLLLRISYRKFNVSAQSVSAIHGLLVIPTLILSLGTFTAMFGRAMGWYILPEWVVMQSHMLAVFTSSLIIRNTRKLLELIRYAGIDANMDPLLSPLTRMGMDH